jgi:exonuclease III
MKNREISELNDIIHQIDLTDVYRIFHPNATDYTVYPGAHGSFSTIDHILEHKESLTNTEKFDIISWFLSEK